jgi:alkylmercury lyase
MYGEDTKISSRCRHCRETIYVTTTAEGRSLETVTPSSGVVWYNFAYHGCAASSSCPSTAFFCSPDHLEQWQALQTARRNGAQLTMDEVLEVGRAIFVPVLVEPRMTRRQC